MPEPRQPNIIAEVICAPFQIVGALFLWPFLYQSDDAQRAAADAQAEAEKEEWIRQRREYYRRKYNLD
jgi:hypothetical protein